MEEHCMVNKDEIVKSVIQRLEQWKEEGILREKLKEYGLKFHDKQTSDKSDDETPTENES